MLKEFKKPKAEDKADVKKEIKALRERLLMQQQLIKEEKLPARAASSTSSSVRSIPVSITSPPR